MNLDREFKKIRARLHAAIDLRVAIAAERLRGLDEHHRRALGQRFKQAPKGSTGK